MDSMFKIECNGEFREGRALALLSSMVTHNIQNIDMAIISSDGVTIPANRGVLALQSKYIAKVLESVPCCQSTSVSLPFSAVIVKNLLAVISCGSSLPMAGEDLLNVKVIMKCDHQQKDLFPICECREPEGGRRQSSIFRLSILSPPTALFSQAIYNLHSFPGGCGCVRNKTRPTRGREK